MTTPHILYAMPGSLYSAKVRCYLRTRRIPFEERCPGDPRFVGEVVPQVGRWIIPVLQTSDGALVQDSAAILDHLDQLDAMTADAGTVAKSAVPADPVLAVLAHLLDLFGGEGLLRPAMHYRWNFDADNLDFLRADFGAALAPGLGEQDRDAMFAMASGRMRKAAVGFGVVPGANGLIEGSYRDFLARLNQHLTHSPFLLGSTPTLADYGMVGPLYAHLARDPHPSALMKREAPRVWRWVERMNAPNGDAGEYLGRAPTWLDPVVDGTTPQMLQSLEALLEFIAEDFLPEISAQVHFADDWLASRPDLPAEVSGLGLSRAGERVIGMTTCDWRGIPMTIMVMPYRLFMLQRVQDAADRLSGADRATIDDLLARTGLASLLSMQCRRRVEQRGNLETWGPPRAVE